MSLDPFRIVNKECLFAFHVEIKVDLKHIKSFLQKIKFFWDSF